MKIYSENSRYFSEINDEKKAYWLGFLYADGCVHIGKRGSYQIALQLHSKDKDMLEMFLQDIQSNRSVHLNKRGYVGIHINDKEMALDLIKLGCVERKSNILEFPNEEIVPKNLIRHFIRGYMDGDGCISTCVRNRKMRSALIFVCEIKFIGTYSMLDGIKKFFESEKKVLVNRHSPVSCQISFAGRKYRNKVDLLYLNAERYMKRKKQKWDGYKRYMYELDNGISSAKIYIDKYIKANQIENKQHKNKLKICDYKKSKSIVRIIIHKVKNKSNEKHFKMKRLNKILYSNNNKEIQKSIIYQNSVCNTENLRDIIAINIIDKRNKAIIRNKLEEDIYIIDNKKWDKNKKYKEVEQYDLEGNLIYIWGSTGEAAIAFETTSKAIRKVCNRERKSCKGYVWKYSEEIVRKDSKQIYQYTLDGKFIKTWSGVLEAAEYYDVTEQAIRRAITGKFKSSCGFIWRN